MSSETHKSQRNCSVRVAPPLEMSMVNNFIAVLFGFSDQKAMSDKFALFLDHILYLLCVMKMKSALLLV